MAGHCRGPTGYGVSDNNTLIPPAIMRVVIRPDAQTASHYIADYIVRRINAFAPTEARPFVIGLPTGSSPEIVYAELVRQHRAGKVSFRHVVTFNMDEYIGLPREHPESYHSFMYRHLFSHIDIPPSNVHLLDGNAADLAAECAAYEAAIERVGGIELFLAGVGPDGHIAFNEPGSSLASRTRPKTLAGDTVRANARFFSGDETAVPTRALTVGVGTVMAAREVVVIVTGAHKALALRYALEKGVGHMWTVSALQMHPAAMVVADDAATLELRVKTVRYFKEIEQEGTDAREQGPARLTIDTKKANIATDPTELTPDSMSSRLDNHRESFGSLA